MKETTYATSNEYESQITLVPHEAAKLILKLGFQQQEIKLEDLLDLSGGLRKTIPDADAFEYAFLVAFKDRVIPEQFPRLFLANKRGDGIGFNPNSGVLKRLDLYDRRYINSWITWNFPPTVRPDVNLNEAWMLVDVMMDILRDHSSNAKDLGSIIVGSIEEGFDEKWDINAKAFAERLQDMPTPDHLSLWDSAERFWDYGDKMPFDNDTIQIFFNIRDNLAG